MVGAWWQLWANLSYPGMPSDPRKLNYLEPSTPATNIRNTNTANTAFPKPVRTRRGRGEGGGVAAERVPAIHTLPASFALCMACPRAVRHGSLTGWVRARCAGRDQHHRDLGRVHERKCVMVTARACAHARMHARAPDHTAQRQGRDAHACICRRLVSPLTATARLLIVAAPTPSLVNKSSCPGFLVWALSPPL